MSGTYDAAGEVLLRNRVRSGEGGYDVLTPLRLEDGTAVVVDRGWVARNDVDTGRASLAPPTGTVTVRGPIAEPRPLQADDTVDERGGHTTRAARRHRSHRTRRLVPVARRLRHRTVAGPRSGGRRARAPRTAGSGRSEPPVVRVPVVRVRVDPPRRLAHRVVPDHPPRPRPERNRSRRLPDGGGPRAERRYSPRRQGGRHAVRRRPHVLRRRQPPDGAR